MVEIYHFKVTVTTLLLTVYKSLIEQSGLILTSPDLTVSVAVWYNTGYEPE